MWASTIFFTWDLEDLKNFTLSESRIGQTLSMTKEQIEHAISVGLIVPIETKNDMEQNKINDHSFIDAKAELERMNTLRNLSEASKQITDEANRLKESIGIKHDEGKTKFHLLIPEFVKGVADVMTKGADKYSEWNYLHLDKERIIGAHHRHMNAYQRGELNDPETGLSHLFHATCCLQMLWALDNDFNGKEEKKCQT